MRTNNATRKLTDVKTIIDRGRRTCECGHVKEFHWSDAKIEEDKLWIIDFIVDDVLSTDV